MIVRGMEELQGVCAAGKLVMERENGGPALSRINRDEGRMRNSFMNIAVHYFCMGETQPLEC